MKTFIIILLVVLSLPSYSQDIQIQKDSLMQKSRNQKTIGWILMGSGMGMTAGGVILGVESSLAHMFEEDYNSTAATILIIAGIGSMSGGLISLISSHQNRVRAIRLSVGTQTTKIPVYGGWTSQTQPALKLNIRLFKTK